MPAILLLTLSAFILSTVGATHPGRAAEPTAEEIEQARGEAILSNSLALIEVTARELGRSADELDALARKASGPALPPSEKEALLRRGPSALVAIAPMPSDFTAPAAGEAFASAAASHRAVARMLSQAAAEASTLPIDAALEEIRKLDIPADHEFIVFPPDSDSARSVETSLDAIDRSSPLTLSGVEPFIVGVGWGGRTTDYPATGSLLETTNNVMKVICTGTLVGPTEFLTAAHCVCEKNSTSAASCKVANDKSARIAKAKALTVYLPHSGLYGIAATDKNIVVNPDFQIKNNGTRGDLALLRLSEPVLDVKPMPINAASLPIGTSAEIVGFGATNRIDDAGHVVTTNVLEGSAGIKLFAGVEIGACPGHLVAGLLCWNYRFSPTTNLGSTCNGDSGGPVIVTSGGQDVLAAVISGSVKNSVTAPCMPGSELFNTDLAEETNHKWIATILSTSSAAIVSTVRPLLESTINKGRYLQLSPDDRTSYPFLKTPAKITLDAQLPNDSKFITVGLNGTFSNASLSLTVTDIANGDELCSMAGAEPAKVCAFASTGIERVGIEVIGRQFQEVQIVATSFEAR